MPPTSDVPGERRRLLVAGGAAALLLATAPLRLRAQPADPPSFRTRHAQFVILKPRQDVSQIVLRRLDGSTRTIGSYRGKALLMSFWASWCPPCRRELPILERLQARSAAEPFEILPVALDRDPAMAARFIRLLDLGRLVTFVDPDGAVAAGPESREPVPFPLYGLPMTYVIDRHGAKAGYLTGEADWGNPEGLALLRFYGRA